MRKRDLYIDCIDGAFVAPRGGGLERIVEHIAATDGHRVAGVGVDGDIATGVKSYADLAALEQRLVTLGGTR